MSTSFRLKNLNADSVLGVYVDEPIGMDHTLAMAKFQSEIDATLQYQKTVSFRKSIESTLKHIRFLFGDDIPAELVRTAVSLVYAENDASQTG